MAETIHDLGLEIENINIHISGDTATITGNALNQATREKIVLVVGNSAGIAAVDDQMRWSMKSQKHAFILLKREIPK